MQIYPIHNCIVQWYETSPIFLNVFDTPEPHFFYLTQKTEYNDRPIPFTTTNYEMYINDIKANKAYICIPTTATTPEEALSFHPELLI